MIKTDNAGVRFRGLPLFIDDGLYSNTIGNA